jgi:hypothetical protein
VLAVLLGLILVEQRHDLADHHAHGIVGELLGDREQANTGLGQAADMELELKLVPEEPAEGMDHDHVEGSRLVTAGIDHALEFRTAVVGGR